MEWISVTTGCLAVSNSIVKTSTSIHQFVREVRESRSEFDTISAELHSLDRVLELLKDDAASLPPLLIQQTAALLATCLTIVNELHGCIGVLDREGLTKADKKSRWVASRDHISKLRWTLEGYKETFGLAVDLVALTGSRQQPNHQEKRPSMDTAGDDEEENQMAKVASQISGVAAKLLYESQQNGAVARLEHYLDALKAYATEHMELERRTQPSKASSVTDAPDSAIDIGDDHSLPIMRPESIPATPSLLPSERPSLNMPIEEIEELLDELKEMPARPPTPPPRSLARGRAASHGNLGTRPDNAESDSRPGHSRSHSFAPRYMAAWGEGPPPSDTTSIRSGLTRSDSRVSRTWNSIFENPRAEVPRPSTSSSSIQSFDPSRPTMMRRSSSRLSNRFRSFSIRSSSSQQRKLKKPEQLTPPIVDPEPEPEPNTEVFGVPLAESLKLARGLAGARHDDSSRRTTREYPLSVLRCVYFIRDVDGISTPHIFGQDSNPKRLARLRHIFSSPDFGYGRDLDWSQFTVHEAADIILAFISELPTPLVCESVARRWVSMSRQAIQSPSVALRLDQGMDFWEEAFIGLKGGSAARALLKLLLDLWGEVADKADENDMTAERLAGRVVKGLMQLEPGKYETDFMLALAFMIRRRSEYVVKTKGEERKSNAAF